MNVDGSAFAIRASRSGGDAAGARTDPGAEAPSFKVDIPEEAALSATKQAQRDLSRETREARRENAGPVEQRVARGRSEADPSPAAGEPEAGRPAAEPARASRDASTRGARTADAREPSRTDAANETVARAPDRPATKTADTDANADASDLPDRMLALLGGGWAAPATPPAPPSGGALAVMQPALAGAVPPETSIPAAIPAPTGPGAPAVPPPATAPAALALSITTSSPVATTPASAAAGDAFAALAAGVAGAMPGDDAATPTLDTTLGSTPDGSLSSLAARPADAPAAPARAAVVAMPAAGPLMLDADFEDGLGSRVTWMAEQRLGHAEIRVSPEGLGPIDVRLQMDGARVHAQFNAINPDVRHALESGMDRLRDLLGRQGMELGQAQVGSGSRQGGDGRPTTPGGSGATGDVAGEPQLTTVRLLRARGLLDEYA